MHDRGIVEAPGFQVEERRMSRRRGVERRPALRAEMPGQRIAAVAGFCKAAGRSFDEAELPGRNPDPDIERAAGAFPAIGAVAVIGRADLAVILVPHGAAETATGYNFGYVAGIGMRSRSVAWTGLHRGRYVLLQSMIDRSVLFELF